MRRMFAVAALLLVAVSISAAEQGRGNANNPNGGWGVNTVFDPLPDTPFLSFAFCSFGSNPQVNLGNAYNNAQGDEGIDNAFNTSQCLVLTDDPDHRDETFPIILDDWPDECVDNVQWDADPLPHEESCPPLL